MLQSSSRFAFCLALGLVAACTSNEDPAEPFVPAGPGEFESGNPGRSGSGPDNGRGTASPESSDGDANTAGPQAPPGVVDDGGGAERAIEEADIIKIEGGKLYALSRYGGLSVVDVGRRDRLSLLGRHKIVATPFEMYVHDGIVIALYQGYGQYSYDEASTQWVYYQTSEVVVLDARAPNAIRELDRFQIAGDISDSRIIGNILYVAAFENGQCWGCERDRPRTVVMSLDVSDPAAVRKVDEVSREDRQNTWSWQRSLTATDERLYLAGPTWSNSDRPVGSTIEVFDISDPSGDIKDGTSVQVTGQIQSRWQMDEYQGVLRVVSQPFQWALTTPPVLETFRVTSALEVARLGRVSIELPRPEQLQSARFDGTRGYVVTAERTDPLFTIDLANPAAPRQMGELEMPGWLYHMEPRGDRLLGLGYDQNNPAGAITVSLFDVSDLAKPSMLRRVNFGGNWASLAEDQNRIHKSFNVLDSEGLILVPFSGYTYTEDVTEEGCGVGKYLSGVQLVDFANDDLALRGVAPGKGQARRGFMLDDRLLTMSDERVESFDIEDRDAPRTTASLPLAQFVTHAQAAGSNIVRVGENWWSGVTELDVTTVAGASSPSALGRLEIPQLTETACYGGSWLDKVHANDDFAYFFYNQYAYDPATRKSLNTSRLVTVDVGNPSAPVIAADAELDFVPAYPNYLIGAVGSGESTVNVGSTFVVANRTYRYTSERYAVEESELKVVDMADPGRPNVATVTLPATFGATGLIKSGTVIATSQYQPLVPDQSRVRFYLERIDVSNPAAPQPYPSVNIPGSLLAYDHETERAFTVDYRVVTLEDVPRDTCYEFGSYQFRAENPRSNDVNPIGSCDAIQQTLRLIQLEGDRAIALDSYELDTGSFVGGTALGDDRVFVSVSRNRGGYAVGPEDFGGPLGYFGFASGHLELLTLSGLRSGELQVGRAQIETGNHWYGSGPIVASGRRAALSTGFQGKLAIVDATNATKPVVVREVELPGYVSDLDVVGTTVVASLGQDGAATVSLTE